MRKYFHDLEICKYFLRGAGAKSTNTKANQTKQTNILMNTAH